MKDWHKVILALGVATAVIHLLTAIKEYEEAK